MKRCKKCEHWSRSDIHPESPYYNYGGCRVLDKDNYSFMDDWPIMCGYGNSHADYFLTRKDFGCVFWKKKKFSIKWMIFRFKQKHLWKKVIKKADVKN